MMSDPFANPGDVLEGQGVLLQHGRRIADIHYHLTIPNQTHFIINPAAKFKINYADYATGFILVSPANAPQLKLAAYTLELSDKSKKHIQIERRYKKIKRENETFISFGINII